MQIDINKKYSFDRDQYLWRYMDLHRLIYFLHSGNIFFSPLSTFFDPLEGITEKHLQDKQYVEALEQSNGTNNGLSRKSQEEIIEKKQKIKSRFKSGLEEIQKTYFASCWYLGVRESLAMWDTYSNKDSVAIKFDPQDLCEAILSAGEKLNSEDFDLMVHGKVEYFKISPFDPTDDGFKNCRHRYKGFLKDLSYRHEEEFRFLVMQNNDDKTYDFFELDLGNLKNIDFYIVTHPQMEPWKHKNIHSILQTTGLEHKLVKSQIPTRRQVFDTP